MLSITERDHGAAPPDDRLVLPFELRRRSRLRVTLDSGAEAALVLERGGILRGGDRLRAEDGRIVAVVAAAEAVATATFRCRSGRTSSASSATTCWRTW
jgi:urease accessory protein